MVEEEDIRASPGPWRAVVVPGFQPTVEPEGQDPYAADKTIIAEVVCPMQDDAIVYTDEVLANSTLVAASRDLYGALDALLLAISTGDPRLIQEAIRTGGWALAKARGEGEFKLEP